MGQTIFKILILGISGSIASLAIFSCSQSKPDEPVARPVMPMQIDPDQKALPKDAPVGDAPSNVLSNAPSNVLSNVPANVLPNKPQNEGETGVQADAVPPTPTIDELKSKESGSNMSAQSDSSNEGSSSATVEPEALLQAAASIPREGGSARPPKEVGSGPQVRYIKAAILNIRAEPNRYSKILGLLRGYDKVHVKINGYWAELEAGQWIRSRWLVKNQPKKIVGLSSDDDMAGPEIKKKNSIKSGKKKRKVIK